MVSFSVGRRRRRFVPGDEVFPGPGVREPAVLDHRGSGSCHYSSSSRVYIHLEHAMSNECREVTHNRVWSPADVAGCATTPLVHESVSLLK